ncbi:MAG TPA: helix-hairpin-helix domain-containing protein, partial [Micropruina sp.]|nr:helix-hairpin-helix domain-containing protein [Micropruina sp.]
KTLLTHFGSMKKLRAASVDELAQVPGIGPRLAAAILEAMAEPVAETVNLTTGEVLDGAP